MCEHPQTHKRMMLFGRRLFLWPEEVPGPSGTMTAWTGHTGSRRYSRKFFKGETVWKKGMSLARWDFPDCYDKVPRSLVIYFDYELFIYSWLCIKSFKFCIFSWERLHDCMFIVNILNTIFVFIKIVVAWLLTWSSDSESSLLDVLKISGRIKLSMQAMNISPHMTSRVWLKTFNLLDAEVTIIWGYLWKCCQLFFKFSHLNERYRISIFKHCLKMCQIVRVYISTRNLILYNVWNIFEVH